MPHLDGPRAADLAEAAAFLTRLPVGRLGRASELRGARASWAWPLAGALVGLLAAVPAALALAIGLSPPVAAALALCAQALATGALHEDGLADCADGLWGGRDRASRLAIMADSRVGGYGALALALGSLLRWAALAEVLAEGAPWGPLLATGALSRWPMAAILWALPPAREGGLARLVGRPGTGTLLLGAAVALVVALAAVGWAALAAALAVAAATLAWVLVLRAKLDGQTGDGCGAVQQLGEMAALLALAAGSAP